jgi:hypothetical protein
VDISLDEDSVYELLFGCDSGKRQEVRREGELMRIELDLPPDSYEAALAEEEWISFRALLASDVTLAEMQKTVPVTQSEAKEAT